MVHDCEAVRRCGASGFGRQPSSATGRAPPAPRRDHYLKNRRCRRRCACCCSPAAVHVAATPPPRRPRLRHRTARTATALACASRPAPWATASLTMGRSSSLRWMLSPRAKHCASRPAPTSSRTSRCRTSRGSPSLARLALAPPCSSSATGPRGAGCWRPPILLKTIPSPCVHTPPPSLTAPGTDLNH